MRLNGKDPLAVLAAAAVFVDSEIIPTRAARAAVAKLVAAAREAVHRHPDLLGLESALDAFPEDTCP